MRIDGQKYSGNTEEVVNWRARLAQPGGANNGAKPHLRQ
jgi:hypothetical protein